MASKNGTDPAHEAPVALQEAPPVEAEAPVVEAEQPVVEAAAPLAEPSLEVTSMQYWLEMTDRQIARLQAEVDRIDAMAKPLEDQLAVLRQARAAVAGAGKVRLVTDFDRATVARLVGQGKNTTEITEALPHLKRQQVYTLVYNARNKLQRQSSS